MEQDDDGYTSPASSEDLEFRYNPMSPASYHRLLNPPLPVSPSEANNIREENDLEFRYDPIPYQKKDAAEADKPVDQDLRNFQYLFQYNPIPYDLNPFNKPELSQSSQLSLDLIPSKNEVSRNVQKHPWKVEEEKIPWDEIAKLPYFPNRHMSWDNLQVPIPYRFQPEHMAIVYKGQKKEEKVKETEPFSSQFVDSIWRLHFSQRYFQEGEQDSAVAALPRKTALIELKESQEKPMYIPLEQFLHHAFHLLSARASLTFQIADKNNYTQDDLKEKKDRLLFKKNPVILIHGISPSALYSYSKPLLSCGSIVKRLNQYSAIELSSSTGSKMFNNNNKQNGAVGTAFLRYIANYLKLYQTVLMLNAPKICTLTGLNNFIGPFKQQLEVLEYILDNSCTGNAVDLLSSLNFQLFYNETLYVSDLIRGLFITCASAYLKYVSDWIFRGSLGPPSEFHIERLGSTMYKDRRFWTKQFCNKNSVPMFLEESLELIFETGKAVNLLNQIQNENVFASIPLFCYDTDTLLTPALEFEDVAQLRLEWKEKLESFLTDESHLISGISQSIKQVLTCQHQGIDFEGIENAKILREKAKLTQKLEDYESQKKRKQEFFEILQEQVEESKARKSLEVEASKLENVKNNDYWIMKDKRDLIEEKKHRMKHFGDEKITNNNRKGVYARLHSSSSAAAGTSSNSDVEKATETIEIFESEIPGDAEELVNRSRKMSKEVVAPYFADRKLKSDGDAGTGDQIDTGTEINSAEIEIVDNLPQLKKATNPFSLDLQDFEFNNEKFDPDKVPTKSPPPYKKTIDFETVLSQLSVSAFTKAKEEEEMKSSEEKSLISCQYDPYCLSEFLSQSIAIPLKAQNQMVNAAVLHYFVSEKNLFFHLEALNNFLCLQNGLFGHVLSTLLIQEVDEKKMRTREDVISKGGRLNIILAEALSTSVENEEHNEFIQNLGFAPNKDFLGQTPTSNSSRSVSNLSSTSTSTSFSTWENKKISPGYDILDSVHLSYTVKWPLNILLTEDVLHHYEKLFVFLMQLVRVELLLQRVYVMLKCKNAKSAQFFTLHQYRYRLLHFVTTVRNYVNVTVIHTAWDELCSSFTKMDSLEKIYEYLVRHIKSVHSNCLLGAKAEGVMKLLRNQLVIIETFCCNLNRVAAKVDWVKGQEIDKREFKKLVHTFKAIEELGKVFTQVAYKLVNKGYYPKVAYFLELYNFNGYFQIKA